MNSPAILPGSSEISSAIKQRLVCPVSHAPLEVSGDSITCKNSDFNGSIRDNVAVMLPAGQPSFFDDKYEIMQRGHEREGERAFCYAQQTALLTSYLRAGQVVLDVGCGPSLPYQKPEGVFVIGLEPSFHSIQANRMLDLRVYGTATSIPMADASVDIVVCLYSIHHMVGKDQAATRANVTRAFSEFGRVLKPDGLLFIFEMTPNSIFWGFQRLVWNAARRLLPNKLDMYFWSAGALAKIGDAYLPPGAMLEKIFFGASAFTVIPPVFSLPWLRLPRLVYPLDAKLYKWRMPAR